MPWKTPRELNDDDIRGAVVHLLMTQQEMEATLAEVTMMVLTVCDELKTSPTEDEYRSVVDDLVEYLERTYARMQQVRRVTQQLEEHTRN